MDETQWLAAERVAVLLGQLRGASPRKLWLFACVCCRQLPEVTESRVASGILTDAERCAAGLLGPRLLKQLWQRAMPSVKSATAQQALRLVAGSQEYGWMALGAVVAMVGLAERGTQQMREQCARPGRRAERRAWGRAKRQRRLHLCNLLRDLFLPPPRLPPPVEPAVLAWRQGLVAQIARSIHDDNRYDTIPILADALEEAGCTDRCILAHARSPEPHTRGCWLVDHLIGLT